MAALQNGKHELFALALAKGETADQAYQSAGYSENRGNATRLKANESVQARVAELQEKVAKRTEMTVAGITEKLLAIAEKAEGSADAPLLSVARASYMDAAKLNGLVIDKIKAETVNRTSLISDRPISEAEWESEVANFT